jgi:CheY-like chemotaxis protein
LVREVRAIYPSLPIVIASGHATDELRQLFKDTVAIAFLQKPYTSETLRAAMQDIGIRY